MYPLWEKTEMDRIKGDYNDTHYFYHNEYIIPGNSCLIVDGGESPYPQFQDNWKLVRNGLIAVYEGRKQVPVCVNDETLLIRQVAWDSVMRKDARLLVGMVKMLKSDLGLKFGQVCEMAALFGEKITGNTHGNVKCDRCNEWKPFADVGHRYDMEVDFEKIVDEFLEIYVPDWHLYNLNKCEVEKIFAYDWGDKRKGGIPFPALPKNGGPDRGDWSNLRREWRLFHNSRATISFVCKDCRAARR
jgi:hypothetical protein